MKLYELFDRVPFSPEIKKIEDILNKTNFSPDNKVKDEDAVLDLELPTKKMGGGDAHFFQRVRERGITGNEITNALKRGYDRIPPDEKERLAYDEDSEGEKLDFFDPVTKVFIPLIVNPNPECKSHPDDTSVCSTKQGNIKPKHKLVAKTIYKKDR